MRIDPNRTIDTNALTPSNKATGRAAGTGEGAAAGQVSGPVVSALSMDQVRQTLDVSSQDKIARARALIASGQLDTLDAIHRAAQAIAKFGI